MSTWSTGELLVRMMEGNFLLLRNMKNTKEKSYLCAYRTDCMWVGDHPREWIVNLWVQRHCVFVHIGISNIKPTLKRFLRSAPSVCLAKWGAVLEGLTSMCLWTAHSPFAADVSTLPISTVQHLALYAMPVLSARDFIVASLVLVVSLNMLMTQ